jgi:hypothetical protein
MSVGDDKMWSDPNNILATINIIVMGLFTFLVWRATKNGAEAAKATYELNERLVRITESEKNLLRDLYLSKIIVELQRVISVVEEQGRSLNTSLMKSVIKPKMLTDEQLAKCFSSEERHIIEYPYVIFQEYLEKYWLSSTGEFEGGFPGNKHIEVQEESKALGEYLKESLDKLYRIV